LVFFLFIIYKCKRRQNASMKLSVRSRSGGTQIDVSRIANFQVLFSFVDVFFLSKIDFPY